MNKGTVKIDGDILTIGDSLMINVPVSIEVKDIDETLVEGLWLLINQLRDENTNLRNGLRFYADQEHMYGHQTQEWEIDAGWDTCSGEPGNWLFPENDDPIGIENGSVANAVLNGAIMTPDSDEIIYIFPLTKSVGE